MCGCGPRVVRTSVSVTHENRSDHSFRYYKSVNYTHFWQSRLSTMRDASALFSVCVSDYSIFLYRHLAFGTLWFRLRINNKKEKEEQRQSQSILCLCTVHGRHTGAANIRLNEREIERVSEHTVSISTVRLSICRFRAHQTSREWQFEFLLRLHRHISDRIFECINFECYATTGRK